MTTEENAGKPPAPRKTPWSVLITAAVLFVACGWMWNELRKDSDAMKGEREREASRARANESSRPKILGLDVIPQDVKPAASPSDAHAAPSVAPSVAPSP